MKEIPFENIADSGDSGIFEIRTKAPGPSGSLPLTAEMLLNRPSGDLFGLSLDAGMGWNAAELGGKEFLLLSTHGGIRAADGSPIALGYHTGHWEVSLLVEAAARELKEHGAIPFAAFCTDPCDGRTQGTTGMFDSLPYRNDAAIVFRRLIRSLPTRRGVIGVATCDKGLPAMMMALAGMPDLPCGAGSRRRNAARRTRRGRRARADHRRPLRARRHHPRIRGATWVAAPALRPAAAASFWARRLRRRWSAKRWACRCRIRRSRPPDSPSGSTWRGVPPRALLALESRGLRMRDILTDAALHNAMTVHAAFGGSTNLILHLAAIAHAAGLRLPSVEDWAAVNRRIPRLVDALPNGPRNHPTVQVFLAGGVPEVMLHLRREGLLDTGALTVAGVTLGRTLDWWESSERRRRLRALLKRTRRRRSGRRHPFARSGHGSRPDLDGLLPRRQSRAPGVGDQEHFDRSERRRRAMASIASPARRAFSSRNRRRWPPSSAATFTPGDVMVLICRGPLGSGMEETYQVTSALKHLEFGKHVAVVTDARFSGVSTGACVGHVSPEALAGGPIGKLEEGDIVEIVVDRRLLEGSVNLVGAKGNVFGAAEGTRTLAARTPRPDLKPDAALPGDTRLWAALQEASGGAWSGCVYDVDRILRVLEAGRKALAAADGEA